MRPRPAAWLAVVLASVAIATSPASAQSVTVANSGPRGTARELRDALARPHRVIVGRDTLLSFPRDSAVTETLIIIGAPRVTLASRVEGSVIVVGGDLFLHPGVAITGDAIAYGGGVYTTMLGTVGGRVAGYRDFTFDAVQGPSGYTLSYRPLAFAEFKAFELPGAYGVRLPAYDRVNGLSLPFGPRFWIDSTRFSVEPIITYRSDLGELDPEVRSTMHLDRAGAVQLTLRRTTLTNDGWIRGSFVNSLGSLVLGRDVRNYWRADRAELEYRRDVERDGGVLTPFIGVLTERGWSAPPDIGAGSGPWSIFGRTDADEGMRRPNPPVERGRISSLFGGVGADWQIDDVELDATSYLEYAPTAPNDRSFTQATFDARVRFPALRNHRFQSEAHSVLTFGETAPPQRFAYLGGSGTFPTRDLLSMGGDQLLFFESMYTIPIERIQIKFAGSPSIAFRHMIGSAGVDRLLGFVNNVGLRVSLSLLKVDYVIDPETGDTSFSFGVSFAR